MSISIIFRTYNLIETLGKILQSTNIRDPSPILTIKNN